MKTTTPPINSERRIPPTPPMERSAAPAPHVPVFAVYKGRWWQLNDDLAHQIKTVLDHEPRAIAKRRPNDSDMAICSLAEVIRDCLEYNYGDYGLKRGDTFDWRLQALWTLCKYARNEYEHLDEEAKNPGWEPWAEIEEE